MARRKASPDVAVIAREAALAPRKAKRRAKAPEGERPFASIAAEPKRERRATTQLAELAEEIVAARPARPARRSSHGPRSLASIADESVAEPKRERRATSQLAELAEEIVAARPARRSSHRPRSLASIAAESVAEPKRERRATSQLAELAEEIVAARHARHAQPASPSLASIADEIVAERPTRHAQPASRSLASIAAEITASGDDRRPRAAAPAPIAWDSPLDLALPARPISMELISGRGHYERVLRAVLGAKVSVWIATANVKGLMVEDSRARPGKRRSMKKTPYVSVLSHLDDLAARGVELRLLHAELPSGPFREELANHPRLLGGALALRRCPRVHLKAVIVDGELLYLGSANWTGAGLGAKGSGRRNFEIGFVTDDAPLLDQVQALYERIWSGGECGACKLHDECPGPLAEQGGERPLVQLRKRPRRSSTRS